MTAPSPSTVKATRVVVVDDHPMLRERLAHLISREADMTICGEADNIQEAMEIIQQTKPDIAIVDITLHGSSGLELIKNLKAAGCAVPILVLSMHDESLYAQRALRAGARGYVTKHEASETVMIAIRRVLQGEVYLSDQLTSRILKNLVQTGLEIEGPAVDRLTDRELEVFQMIGRGRATREIAEALNLGVKTVDTYRERIKQKLNLQNAAELHHQAIQWVNEME